MSLEQGHDSTKRSSSLAVWAAAGANLGIAVAKFTAAAFTGSSAMMAEGIHSTVDTGNELFLMIGKKRSRKPPDDVHPFGYGREMYFWTLLVGIMIFALGGGLSFYEGIVHLLHPEPISDPIWSFAVLLIAIVFEGSSLWIGSREYRRSKPMRGILTGLHGSDDPSIFAVVVEDTAALCGLLVALIGVGLSVWFGEPLFDGLASIAIGIMLMGVAVFMIQETRGLLIGEALDPKSISRIRKLIEEDPGVARVSNVLTSFVAPREVVIAVDLRLRDVSSSQQMRTVIGRLVEKIKSSNKFVNQVYIVANAMSESGN